MRYEEFKEVWTYALQESGLRPMGAYPGEETLDFRSMDRRYSVIVEPVGRQDAEPFFVTAKLSWRWDALQSARTATSENDIVTELLGRQRAQRVRVERRWLRIDIGLHATLPYGEPIPMPPRPTWAEWTREVTGRLERIERLVPDKVFKKRKDGMLEVLAWQGEPAVEATCAPGGELLLEGVEVAAWQAVNLPRHEDDSGRKPDAHPGKQLAVMFRRVRASLHAWMEAMDHLLP